MIILYNKNETNFINNGIGILRDSYNVYINRKINSIYELTFEYPKNGFLANNLEYFMIIKANGQLFRINSINKTLTSYKITAKHIMYDLNNNFLEDVAPTNQNGEGALNWILERTVYPHRFTGFSDIQKISSARYVEKNVINAILGESNSLVKRWSGEIDADNFTIKLLNRLGSDRGFQLSLRKNITGLNISINIDDLITKFMPKGYDGLLLPEKYVESPLINNYPFQIIRVLDIHSAKISDEMTCDQAYQLMRDTCNQQFQDGIDKPKINVKVDFVELSKTKEYEKYKNLETVYLGDTVSIFLPEYNLNANLRVISTSYNVLKNKYEKLELGDALGSLSKQQVNLTQSIENIKEENKNALNDAKEKATEQLLNALGGYVVKTQSEIFIMDTDNMETAREVWRWNLNGLGHSSTGVNGPYETAITQDGRIVADFITTGIMSIDRIQGLSNTLSSLQFNMDGIIQTVSDQNSKISQTLQNISGRTKIVLEKCLKSDIVKLVIKGNDIQVNALYPSRTLYPSKTLYPRKQKPKGVFAQLLPSDDLLPDDNLLPYGGDSQISVTNENGKSVIYDLGIDYSLKAVGDVCDEYILENNKAKIIRRIDENWTVKDSPVEEDLGELIISLEEGNNTIQVMDDIADMEVTYVPKNNYTDVFATKKEMESKIEQSAEAVKIGVNKKLENYSTTDETNATIKVTADEINGEVAKKVNNEEYTKASIVAKINDNTSSVKIEADNVNIGARDVLTILAGNSINLLAYWLTIDSTNFKVTPEGNMTCNNANVKGKVESSDGNIGGWAINSQGLSNGTVFIKNNGASTIYTVADLIVMRGYIMNYTGFDLPQSMIDHYDFNGDGKVTAADYKTLQNLIGISMN